MSSYRERLYAEKARCEILYRRLNVLHNSFRNATTGVQFDRINRAIRLTQVQHQACLERIRELEMLIYRSNRVRGYRRGHRSMRAA